MRGKSYTFPPGMILKKHYCAKCGTLLKKERTHRVVTENDKDYYLYHKRGRFPRYDYDVYEYRYKCPSCEERISYYDQCVTARIQKKCGHHVLSENEINEHLGECKKKHKRFYLYSSLLRNIIFSLIVVLLFHNNASQKNANGWIVSVFLFALLSVALVIRSLRSYKIRHGNDDGDE